MTRPRSYLHSTVWAIVEAGTLAVVSFGSLLAMAWLLGPLDFGIAATALTIVQLLLVVVGPGLVSGPLIQRQDLRAEDVDSAFWSALLLAVALCAATWLLAPSLAAALDQPMLAPVLAVASLALLPAAYEYVEAALLRREFGFRRLAIRSLISRIAGAAVGLGLAFAGAGPWSIVAQHVVTGILGAAVLWAWSPRRIGLRVRRDALRDLAGFSAPAMASTLMAAGGPRLLQLIAAFALGPHGFAFLHVGLRIVETLREMVTDLANNLAFPMFARVQDDHSRLTRDFLTATSLLCVLGMPAFLGLAAFAGVVVPAVLGASWLEAVPVVRILALGAALGFAAAFFFALLWALGRPALGLGPRIGTLAGSLVVLLLLAPYGPAAAAAAWAARQALDVAFAVAICPALLPVTARMAVRAVGLPAAVAVLVVLALLLLDRGLLSGLADATQVAALGLAGALLTALAAYAIHPELGPMVLDRLRPGATARVRTPD